MTERATRIDFHAHVLDPGVFEIAAGKNVISGFGARPVRLPDAHYAAMTEPSVQIQAMDACGIDKHVISSPTVIQGTAWAEPRLDLDLCRRVNDTVASWVSGHPGRFIGTFVLPLQDLNLALPEMERCVRALGMRVANLPASVRGRYLGDPALLPFWQAVEAHDVVAYIHPDGVRDPWFQDYGLWNSLGQSIEETKVMASLIYEGVLERFPSIPMVMAHGGGYFPHYMGRLDRNVTNVPASMKNITAKPSAHLRRFYYDTCVYEPQVLHALIARAGADRLVMGSDFPVNLADPVAFLRDECGLPKDDLSRIGGAVAAALLPV